MQTPTNQADNQNLAQGLYRVAETGQIVGHPKTMRQLKQERRQRRLQRRAAFRAEKRA